MSRLNWNLLRDYEIGVDRGVYYPRDRAPEVWNGLISVTEKTSDISELVRYVEGRKIVNSRREDSFSATLTSFSYPDSFFLNLRKPFGMSYRVQTSRGYKIHLVYNALALVSSRTYNQSEAPTPISFDIATIPSAIPESAPSSHLIVDSAYAYPEALTQFEDILYGTDDFNGRLPSVSEVFDVFEAHALYRVIDNGDGTFTLEAPDDVIAMLSDTIFDADWPRPVYLSEDAYVVRSW